MNKSANPREGDGESAMCTCDGGGSIQHGHDDNSCTGGHSPSCFTDLHAAHYYPNLDPVDWKPVPSENPLDDLACYHREGPVPWLECHDRRVRSEVDTYQDALAFARIEVRERLGQLRLENERLRSQMAFLPRSKYRVVETEEGWEVYGDGDPSFG